MTFDDMDVWRLNDGLLRYGGSAARKGVDI
jgi:hypothetical protein